MAGRGLVMPWGVIGRRFFVLPLVGVFWILIEDESFVERVGGLWCASAVEIVAFPYVVAKA